MEIIEQMGRWKDGQVDEWGGEVIGRVSKEIKAFSYFEVNYSTPFSIHWSFIFKIALKCCL